MKWLKYINKNGHVRYLNLSIIRGFGIEEEYQIDRKVYILRAFPIDEYFNFAFFETREEAERELENLMRIIEQAEIGEYKYKEV